MFPAPEVITPATVARAGGPLPNVPGYVLLGEVGRGGFGVVYRAEQTGLKRVVALKVLRGGAVADDAEIERFRAEAQAVARLQHPHIVQVYEVGECASGDGGTLPFFALEYVEGGTLGDRLAGTPQPPLEAALLIEKLARAVHHAHEHGILHRDLKPTNILLATDGTPKITDFGLAKRMDADGQSASGAIIGTPCYMAPEQASGEKRRTTPAADVYSLGSIFYELLTGRPPFKAATALETIVQVVIEDAVSVRRLNPSVPRDLATICRKCLAKEPSRRYTTAKALADDLRRYLDGLPILARPATRMERMWRWCKREPREAALAAGLAAVITGSVVGLTGLYLRAEERRVAANEAVGAENAVRTYLVDRLLASGSAEKAKNRAITFEEVLNKAAAQIHEDFKNQPALEAYVRHQFGTTYRSLGNYAAAESHLRRAVELRRDLFGPNNPDTLASRSALAGALIDQDKLTEAEPLVQSCLNDSLRELGPGDAITIGAQSDAVRFAAARGDKEKAAAFARQIIGGDGMQPPEVVAAMKVVRDVGEILQQPGPKTEKWPKIEAVVRPLYEQLLKNDKYGPTHPITLGIAASLAQPLHMQGKLAEAEPIARQVWEGRNHVLGPDHKDTWQALSRLTTYLLDQGKVVEAEKLLRPAYERGMRSAKPDAIWAELLASYGRMLMQTGNPSEAEPILRECREIRRKESRPDDWLNPDFDSLLGNCLRLRGQFADAEPLLVESYAALSKADGTPRHQLGLARERLVKLYEAWGKKDLADQFRAPAAPPAK
jgi:tRNA A-37 threonylcarbamoyl transferase component Bud32/tetratricopeptide (TPR) repeat protein